ncbi:unnamed protein product [Amoebophrya sp. A25]|nr:unnamed protein product [Amoebophrya sp. A25]|eukprot:GSA25T00020035001.1
MANYKDFVVDEYDVSSEEEEILDNIVKTVIKQGREKDPDCVVAKGDTIKIHYTMRYVDTTVPEKIKGKKTWVTVDDTRERKESFEVVRGLDEAVVGMCLHEKAEINLSAFYAYGARGAGIVVPPNTRVVYEIEICQVNDSGSGIGELENEEDELDAILASGLPEGDKLVASSSESEDD